MRLLVRILALSRGRDLPIVLGLLITAMILSPPRRSALLVCVLAALVVTLAGEVLHAIRGGEVVGGRRSRLSSWVRATTALGISASIPMILGATLAAIG